MRIANNYLDGTLELGIGEGIGESGGVGSGGDEGGGRGRDGHRRPGSLHDQSSRIFRLRSASRGNSAPSPLNPVFDLI